MLHETLFKSFNNKITTTGKKRDKEHKYQKGRRKLEIIYQCDIVCQILKWKTIKNNIQIKEGDKELKLNVYVLADMVVTRDTAHFERSLLNTDARENAVQIIQ